MKFSISIIIPTTNNTPFLKEAIESVEQQDDASIELIIIAQESHNLPKPRCPFKIITTKTIESPGKARNIGIEYARGDYLLFLDSDDRFIHHALHQLLTEVKNADIVFTPPLFFKNNRDKLKPIYKRTIYKKKDQYFYDSSAFAKLFRREFVKANNLSFPDQMYGEDFYFVYKAYFLASTISFFTTPIYCYRLHHQQLIQKALPSLVFDLEKSYNQIKHSFPNEDYKLKIIRRRLDSIIKNILTSQNRCKFVDTARTDWNNNFSKLHIILTGIIFTIKFFIWKTFDFNKDEK